MASSSWVSSGSEENNLQQIMDQRKRKRMISNRESARRSRMRKQRHLDDLATQVAQIREENNQILSNMNVTVQLYLNLEAENSVLRAQMVELTNRLESLNEIISFINLNSSAMYETEETGMDVNNGGLLHAWSSVFLNQPIMASADMFMR